MATISECPCVFWKKKPSHSQSKWTLQNRWHLVVIHHTMWHLSANTEKGSRTNPSFEHLRLTKGPGQTDPDWSVYISQKNYRFYFHMQSFLPSDFPLPWQHPEPFPLISSLCHESINCAFISVSAAQVLPLLWPPSLPLLVPQRCVHQSSLPPRLNWFN